MRSLSDELAALEYRLSKVQDVVVETRRFVRDELDKLREEVINARQDT